MKSTFTALAAVIVTTGITCSGWASTITFDNLTMGKNRSVETSMTSGSFRAGELNWTVSEMTGNAAQLTGFSVGETVTLFCTQVTANASTPVTFDLIDLADAPLPDGGMGSMRSELISALYASHLDNAFTSNTHAAAFQIAIWEIVHEDESAVMAGDLSASDGEFQITGGTALETEQGFGFTAVDLANSWLDGLMANGLPLMAMSSATNQDQVFVVVPLPAPVLLAGLGLLAVPLLRRRFMN